MDEHGIYPWVIQHSHGKSIIMEVLQGKSSVNGPLSIAMLNNQRVFFLSWQNGDRRPSVARCDSSSAPPLLVILVMHQAAVAMGPQDRSRLVLKPTVDGCEILHHQKDG